MTHDRPSPVSPCTIYGICRYMYILQAKKIENPLKEMDLRCTFFVFILWQTILKISLAEAKIRKTKKKKNTKPTKNKQHFYKLFLLSLSFWVCAVVLHFLVSLSFVRCGDKRLVVVFLLGFPFLMPHRRILVCIAYRYVTGLSTRTSELCW